MILCVSNYCIGATITVTTNEDIAAHSLRAAIRNAKPGDTIEFDMPSSIITIATAFPPVPIGSSSLPITIDGTTQPTTKNVQIVVSPTAGADALTLQSFAIVKGLTINGARTAITAGSNNQILNSFIGTDPTGVTAHPNITGISLTGNTNIVSSSTISGNTGIGINIQASSTGNMISSNTIGASSSDTALGNGSFGIQVLGATNTIMGNNISFQSATPGIVVSSNTNKIIGNTISSNMTTGMIITGNSNTISSNTIESSSGSGISINNTGSLNVIGSSSATANTITSNTGAGIVVGTSTTSLAVQNQIQYNSIAGNGLLGIDLGNLGIPLAQQSVQPGSGPNHLQNAPIISSANIMCNGDVNVSFTLQGAASTPYLIQFFTNATNRNSSNITEGTTPIGTLSIMTNAAGFYGTTTPTTFTPTNTVSNFISAAVTNTGTTNPGDTSEFSMNATVVAPLAPVVTIAGVPSSFVICAGASITLTANVSNEPGPFGYLWSTGATTQTITVAPTTTTTYTVTVTDSSGCAGKATQQVTINPVPTLSLTASATMLCTGGSVLLTASPTGLSSYQFFANGTAISGVQTTNTTTVIPTAASTTYTVVGTNSNGCQGTSSGVNVMVITFPKPLLTASSQTPCLGAPITLTAMPAGYTSYQFFANGVSLGSAQSANTFVTTPPVGTTTSYTVTAMQSNCQGTSAAISVTPQPCAVFLINKCCSKHIFPNDTVSFTINLQNIGADTARNIIVTDVLPSCFTFKKASGSGWTFSLSGQELTAELPLLGVGQKTSFSITATACCNLVPKTFTNTATVESDNSEIASSTATITIVPRPCC